MRQSGGRSRKIFLSCSSTSESSYRQPTEPHSRVTRSYSSPVIRFGEKRRAASLGDRSFFFTASSTTGTPASSDSFTSAAAGRYPRHLPFVGEELKHHHFR